MARQDEQDFEGRLGKLIKQGKLGWQVRLGQQVGPCMQGIYRMGRLERVRYLCLVGKVGCIG